MAIHGDLSSANAREWFGDNPEPLPGQLDLFGGAQSASGTPATERVRKQRTSRGRSAGKDNGNETAISPASRPASTERPPSTGMSVAEVVRLKTEGRNGNGNG